MIVYASFIACCHSPLFVWTSIWVWFFAHFTAEFHENITAVAHWLTFCVQLTRFNYAHCNQSGHWPIVFIYFTCTFALIRHAWKWFVFWYRWFFSLCLEPTWQSTHWTLRLHADWNRRRFSPGHASYWTRSALWTIRSIRLTYLLILHLNCFAAHR